MYLLQEGSGSDDSCEGVARCTHRGDPLSCYPTVRPSSKLCDTSDLGLDIPDRATRICPSHGVLPLISLPSLMIYRCVHEAREKGDAGNSSLDPN